MTEASTRDWSPPFGVADAREPCLRLFNSLTDQKEIFVPAAGPDSKKLTWYSCGPTVYDSAHMGHSRNYVTIDILRRVLEDYFGFNIMFVMNITDVEDKIVLRARRNYLLQKYIRETKSVVQLKMDANTAVASSLKEQQGRLRRISEQIKQADKELEGATQTDERRKKFRQAADLREALKPEEHKLNEIKAVQAELDKLHPSAQQDADGEELPKGLRLVADIAGEHLANWLDSLHKETVTDEEIFRKHSAHFEREFWQDMDALGNRRPTVLTRVTEYVVQIVKYIEQIMKNGFAYKSESGSVYFDTEKFRECGHTYGKLNPWAVGSAVLAAEGEANFDTTEKRSAMDFALWKARKPGEPSWDSPWGQGRPGWHIECSAMASYVIGEKVDIHTGGEDLRFPHHDNELAQAEAYYHHACNCKGQWVNYFMHSGHLSINGLKMSKSLKNFITIREALKTFTARQLRLMFAMQPWGKEMTFGNTLKEEMSVKEHFFKHFFQNVDVLLRRHTPILAWEEPEKDLEGKTLEAEVSVRNSLMDNINTAAALDALLKLVAAANKYMKQREADHAAGGPPPHPYLLNLAARFITKILRIFGISRAGPDQLGFGGPGIIATQEQLLEVFRDFVQDVLPYTHSNPELQKVCIKLDLGESSDLCNASSAQVLDALTECRSSVRMVAKAHKLEKVLEMCDRIRDEKMVQLGIRMEDRQDRSSVWMAEDPAELQAEAEERQKASSAAEMKKRKKLLEEKEKRLEKLEKQARLPTVQEALREKYSRFDQDGQDANPTHDKDGNELDKEGLKKGKAAADKARKPRAFYDKHIQEKGITSLQKQREEVLQLQASLQLASSVNGTNQSKS